MRSIVCLGLVLCICVVAFGDQTIQGTITAVNNDKGTVTFKTGTFNKDTKKFEYGEPVTLKVAKDVVVAKGKRDKATKMVTAGDPIEGGLKADTFTKIDSEKGMRATIITDYKDSDEKKPMGMIKSVLIRGGKGKKTN